MRDCTISRGRASRRRAYFENYGSEPFVARACPVCGGAQVVTHCGDCGDCFIVCDCSHEGASFDRYVATDGRCMNCRPWERFDEVLPPRFKGRMPRRAPKGGA